MLTAVAAVETGCDHVWVGDAYRPFCSVCGVINDPRRPRRYVRRLMAASRVSGTMPVDPNFFSPPPIVTRVPAPTVLVPRTPRSPQWYTRLERCWERDGEGCFYCGKELAAKRARLDHFIPASRGGPDGVSNRRAACASCDDAKGSRMPWEFMPERFPPPAGSPETQVAPNPA